METISPITEDNKRLAIRMYKSLFGVNPQEAVREAEKRAEEESKRAKEEAKRAKEEEKENTIVSLYTNLSLTIEQIAKGMNLKDEFIKKVLEKKGFLN